MELLTNETYYSNMYSHIAGLVGEAVRVMSKDCAFSELYDILGLCSVLKCNIRSIYPKIDFRSNVALVNNVFTPAPNIISNHEIKIMWSHMKNEQDAREINHGAWSPNHFVPLLSPAMYHQSDDSNRPTSIMMVGFLFL